MRPDRPRGRRRLGIRFGGEPETHWAGETRQGRRVGMASHSSDPRIRHLWTGGRQDARRAQLPDTAVAADPRRRRPDVTGFARQAAAVAPAAAVGAAGPAVDILRHPAPNHPGRGPAHRLPATGAPIRALGQHRPHHPEGLRQAPDHCSPLRHRGAPGGTEVGRPVGPENPSTIPSGKHLRTVRAARPGGQQQVITKLLPECIEQ